MERASAAIAAAGGPGDAPRIEGPRGETAVMCDGAALVLQGLAVEASDRHHLVYCGSEGRAELSGCTLTSTEGNGLEVDNGATATMDGGSISG